MPDRVAARGSAWLAESRLGVSAATGESSDAHDVVGLESFADSRAHDRHLNSGWRKLVPGAEDAPVTEARLARLEDLVNWMTFKLEHLDHVFEFSTAAFKTQVDKGSDEFDSLVDDEHERLLALDDSVEATVGGTIETRVEALEKEFFTVFDAKVPRRPERKACSLVFALLVFSP